MFKLFLVMSPSPNADGGGHRRLLPGRVGTGDQISGYKKTPYHNDAPHNFSQICLQITN